MTSLLSVLFPQSPPEPQQARTVRFPGGDQGGRAHEPYEVRDAKNRMHNTIFRARRKRAQQERERNGE